MKTLDEIEAAAKAAENWPHDTKVFIEAFEALATYKLQNSLPGSSEWLAAVATREHVKDANHIATSNPETILALCADLRACREAFSHASLGLDVLGYDHSLWKSGLEVALKNLEKWGI